MGRFIDAEKCPCKTCGISYCHENCNKYYEWLNGCDYDVEKVVEELEEMKQNFVSNAQMLSANQIEKAIEIVRKGGVE